MKINEAKPYLETSGELEEQFFSIQDTGMIFDILRNKMYSNPILAITREISCNARDAHREVGKTDVPVEIHLPNNLEPEYRIKDFGPGISPDRMSNIFIKYTASTKRNDNVQTGGFGLGAKTPFSYSDSFSIITIHNGIRYLYNCLIDSTKVGKLMLGDESPTDLPNGTEIIIPVLPKNFAEFISWTEHACRHWTVKPNITGGKIVWSEFNKILEGKAWALVSVSNNSGHTYGRSQPYADRAVKVIIDGIEYPLDIQALRKYANTKMIDACNGNFLLYFGVGELSLSASREQIYLDEKTQKLINVRLEEIEKDIQKIVTDKIEAFPTYWDANVFYRQEITSAFYNYAFLGPLTWRKLPLYNGSLTLDCPVFSFAKGKYSKKFGTDPNKITRSTAAGISFLADSELYVHDLSFKDPTPKHVKKAFENNPNLKSVQVVCPNGKTTIASLNKDHHLDKMEAKMLSTITKATGRAYTAPSARLLVFKFTSGANAFRQISYSSIEEDTNPKVLCTLEKGYAQDGRYPLLASGKSISQHTLRSLTKKFGYSFYGVDKDVPAARVSEDFGDFVSFEDFLKDNVLSANASDFAAIKFAKGCDYKLDRRLLGSYMEVMKLVKDPTSLYLKRLQTHYKVQELSSHDTGLLDIYEAINGPIDAPALQAFKDAHPEFDLAKIDEEYHKKYPLLHCVQTYNYSDILPEVIKYVNLIDKE